jgi:hypothetical protein
MLSRFATFVGSLTCSHHWVRARWEDGSYGLRCQYCFKRHPQTWDQLLAQAAQPPVPGRSRWSLRWGFDGPQRMAAGAQGLNELPRPEMPAAAAVVRSGARARMHAAEAPEPAPRAA